MTLRTVFRTAGKVVSSAWRRPKATEIEVPKGAVQIFQQTPPVWARWALVLVSLDIMISGSSVDFIWNSWTMAAPEGSPEASGEVRQPESKWQRVPPGQVLRPAWQRAVSSTFFLVSGVTIASAILASRARIVRNVSFVRSLRMPVQGAKTGIPKSIQPTDSVIIQSASQHQRIGSAFPMSECTLTPGSEHQMLLEVKDHGKWILDLRGAMLGGRKGELEPVPEDVMTAKTNLVRTWKNFKGKMAL